MVAFFVLLAILAILLLLRVWRNLASFLWLAAIAVFVYGWYRAGEITLPCSLAAVLLGAAASIVRWLRRPRPSPMTAERLFSIVEPNVELSSSSDRELLQSICNDALLDPNFKDHWNAVEYNPGKCTSPAQCERIREMGYTGKIPENMRAASALIEILKIIKAYNLERWKKAKEAIKSSAKSHGISPDSQTSDVAADFTAIWNSTTQSGRLSRHDAEVLLSIVMQSDSSAERSALATALGAVLSSPVDNAEVSEDLYALASEWLQSIDRHK